MSYLNDIEGMIQSLHTLIHKRGSYDIYSEPIIDRGYLHGLFDPDYLVATNSHSTSTLRNAPGGYY